MKGGPVYEGNWSPCSGLTGAGIKVPVGDQFPSYTGPPFIAYIDDLPSLKRQVDGPFMMPIVDKYNDMGTIVIGKVESGSCKKGETLLIMPNKREVKIEQIWSDDIEVTAVTSEENIKAKVKAMSEEVKIKTLICLVDKKTNEKSKTRPRFIKQEQIAIVRFEAHHPICMETFKDHPQLGRFTLRDEGTTIAIGKILKVVG